MERNQQVKVALYAPNILNICIDGYENGDLSGRMYHLYEENPETFRSVIELTNCMESFFDLISFPQAAVQSRTFANSEKPKRGRPASNRGHMPVQQTVAPHASERKAAPEKRVTIEQLTARRGECSTFFVSVRFRQNACWQGEIEWVEKDTTVRFASILDMIKVMNNAVEDSLREK